MDLYVYEGPVFEYNICLAPRWRAHTQAVSADKAKANLSYQFKQLSGKTRNAKIQLTGTIKRVDKEQLWTTNSNQIHTNQKN